MTAKVHLSAWKSAASEHRFREREDVLMKDRLTESPVALDVETHLGPTHVYHWAGSGEPVVFLHGAGGTGAMWGSWVEVRDGRAMYAIDTIGDLGRSCQRVAVENADDLSLWLDQTLAGLGLEQAHLAGTSYGAYLALNLAATRPQRVRSLYLIEPAGLVPVRIAKFMLWGMSSLLASLLPASLRRVAARRLRNPMVEDREVMRLALYGGRNHRSRLLRPGALSDEQLRAITAPARIVLGAKSELFPVKVSSERAALLSNATTEVISGAGHALATSHLDTLAPDLARFVDNCD